MEKASWLPGRVVTILAGLVLVAIIAAVVAPIFAIGGHGSPKTHCMSNIKQMGTATALYREDHDDHMLLENWIDGLRPNLKNLDLMECPLVNEEKKHYGYAMKIGVLGIDAAKEKDQEHTVMYFETDALGKSVVANLAARSGRHSMKSHVSFLDTHVKFVRLGEPLR